MQQPTKIFNRKGFGIIDVVVSVALGSVLILIGAQMLRASAVIGTKSRVTLGVASAVKIALQRVQFSSYSGLYADYLNGLSLGVSSRTDSGFLLERWNGEDYVGAYPYTVTTTFTLLNFGLATETLRSVVSIQWAEPNPNYSANDLSKTLTMSAIDRRKF
jgi:hypothetical protein